MPSLVFLRSANGDVKPFFTETNSVISDTSMPWDVNKDDLMKLTLKELYALTPPDIQADVKKNFKRKDEMVDAVFAMWDKVMDYKSGAYPAVAVASGSGQGAGGYGGDSAQDSDDQHSDDPDDPDDGGSPLPDPADYTEGDTWLTVFKTYETSFINILVNENYSILMVKVALTQELSIPVRVQRLVFHDEDLDDGQVLGELNLEPGDCFSLFVRAQGGGKRGRGSDGATGGKDNTDDFLNFNIAQPDILSTDTEPVKRALSLTKIDIAGWVKSMDTDKADRLLTILDEQSKATSLKFLIKPYLPFVIEFECLQDRRFMIT